MAASRVDVLASSDSVSGDSLGADVPAPDPSKLALPKKLGFGTCTASGLNVPGGRVKAVAPETSSTFIEALTLKHRAIAPSLNLVVWNLES
jgi:hypothetical protein